MIRYRLPNKRNYLKPGKYAYEVYEIRPNGILKCKPYNTYDGLLDDRYFYYIHESEFE